MTSPTKAVEFVKKTKIDTLAISIGNQHGLYTGKPHIDFNRLNEIRQQLSCPLVLHGGSGIPATQIKNAIRAGISKVNINTEIRIAASQSIKNQLQKNPQAIKLTFLLGKVKQVATEVIAQKIQLCGSTEKNKLIS